MKSLKRGFTLIELLVVIAIIGILSSVVLASLNTARGKGADAAIESDLDSMRAQGELDYSSNNPNGYNTTGGTNVAVCADPIVAKAITNAQTNAGIAVAAVTPNTNETATTVECNQAQSTWVLQAPLKANANTWWCVDNSGGSKQETSLLTNTATVCP
jgi:prepilin-type N-terminal cleavage/methylation domain-containing protein